MIKKSMVLLAGALIILSCSTSQFGWKGESKQPKQEAKTSPYDEDFDPNSLNDEDINPAMDKAIIQSVKQTKTDKAPAEKGKISFETAVNGFRIQLLATKDENQASDIKKQAILKFQEKVYLIFDPPYYRIRVGDCVTEQDAKTLKDEAINKGFADAWIVQSKVLHRGEESNP